MSAVEDAASPAQGCDVFVSYSRKDATFVARLCDALERRGRRAWVDWRDIPPTAEWLAEIYEAIDAADSFVFILSPDSVASRICGMEIAYAANRSKRLIPVAARDCDAATVPDVLQRINWVLMRPQDDFDTALGTLIEGLDTDLPHRKLHTRLLVRAAEWDRKARDASLLLRGRDLEAAEQWLSAASSHVSPAPAPLQLEFLVASRRAATRRQRIVLGSTAAALAVSTALAFWAVRERGVAQRQTQVAVANNLLVESQNDGNDAELRTLLAAESVQRFAAYGSVSPETLEIMDGVAARRARKVGSLRPAGDPGAVTLSSRGDLIATWSGRQVAVRHALGMTSLHDLQARGDISVAAFSPYARTLAIGIDGAVQSYDLAAGAPTPVDLPCSGLPLLLRFDASGRYLAAVAESPETKSFRLCLWSTNTSARLADARWPRDRTGQDSDPTLVFSPDSRFVAAVLPGGRREWRVVLVDTESRAALREWTLAAELPRIAFRGSTLVVAEDDVVWGWSASEGREVSRWTLDGRSRPMALSPDGRFAIVQLYNGVSWVMDWFSYSRNGVYDAAAGTELAQLAHLPAGFTPDGRYLVDQNRLLELPSMRTVRVVPGSGNERLSFSDDTTTVTSLSDGELTVWRFNEVTEAVGLPMDPAVPMARAFSQQTGLIVAASGRDVRLVDPSNPSASPQVRSSHRIDGLALSDNSAFVAGTGEGRLTLWDVPSLVPRLQLELASPNPASDECGPLDAACRRRKQRPWLTSVEPLFMGARARFLAWTADGLRVWTVPDGRLVYDDRSSTGRLVLLELADTLLVAQDDGKVAAIDTASWTLRFEARVHPEPIAVLVALAGGEFVAAVSREVQWDFQGEPRHAASRWSYTLFSPRTGQTGSRQSGEGTLGPWSADGRLVIVQSTAEDLDIVRSADGTRIRADIALSTSVAQRVRPLTFSSAGRFLLAESETPITFGRSEPTLHVVSAGTGRTTMRMPERDTDGQSIRLDRTAPYPESFLADGASDLVAAVVYRDADAYWSIAEDRAEKQLVVWMVSPKGDLTPVLRTTTSTNLAPEAFLAGGRFLATSPTRAPENGASGSYALRAWAIGLEQRLQLACAATEGRLTSQAWMRYIGAFTGEPPRQTCSRR